MEVVYDDVTYKIRHQVIESWTEEQMQNFARSYIGRDDIWVHRNDDDSIALAIGAEPEVWPEDEERFVL